MRLLISLFVIAISVAVQGRAQGNGHAQTPTKTYTDAQSGISFTYPRTWLTSDKVPTYLGVAFYYPAPNSSTGIPPRASFAFSPSANEYKNTVLLSLGFSFFAIPASDETSCISRAVAASSDDAKPTAMTIHGVAFQEIAGGNAGMCHEQASQIDVAYRSGQCLVFERDFNTECFGAGDSKQKLTGRQTQALQRQLDSIMGSVSLHS